MQFQFFFQGRQTDKREATDGQADKTDCLTLLRACMHKVINSAPPQVQCRLLLVTPAMVDQHSCKSAPPQAQCRLQLVTPAMVDQHSCNSAPPQAQCRLQLVTPAMVDQHSCNSAPPQAQCRLLLVTPVMVGAVPFFVDTH